MHQCMQSTVSKLNLFFPVHPTILTLVRPWALTELRARVTLWGLDISVDFLVLDPPRSGSRSTSCGSRIQVLQAKGNQIKFTRPMDAPLELILRKCRNAPVLMSKLCLICTRPYRALLHLCQYLLEDVTSGSGQARSQSSREGSKEV